MLDFIVRSQHQWSEACIGQAKNHAQLRYPI